MLINDLLGCQQVIVQSQKGAFKNGGRGGARNVKLTPDASKITDDSIVKNPIITVSKLTKLLNEHNFNITESCVSKHINSGGCRSMDMIN